MINSYGRHSVHSYCAVGGQLLRGWTSNRGELHNIPHTLTTTCYLRTFKISVWIWFLFDQSRKWALQCPVVLYCVLGRRQCRHHPRSCHRYPSRYRHFCSWRCCVTTPASISCNVGAPSAVLFFHNTPYRQILYQVHDILKKSYKKFITVSRRLQLNLSGVNIYTKKNRVNQMATFNPNSVYYIWVIVYSVWNSSHWAQVPHVYP